MEHSSTINKRLRKIIRQSKPLADNGRGLTTQESSSKQKNDNSTERSSMISRVNLEKAQMRISRWHGFQIAALGCAFLCCTVAAFCLSYALLSLQSDCLLFASWNYTVDTQTKVIRVFYDQTQWGDSYQCSLTLYSLVTAALASFMCCWFFIFFRPRKAFPRQNTHSTASTLVLPILLISFIFVMLMIIASSRLLTGLLYWCDAIVKEFGSCNFPSDYEIILMWNVRTIDYFGFLASTIRVARLCALVGIYSLVGVCILIFPELMFQMEELRPMRNRLLLNLYLIFNDDLFYASAAACMASATNNACGFAFQFYGRVPVFYNFTTIIYGAINIKLFYACIHVQIYFCNKKNSEKEEWKNRGCAFFKHVRLATTTRIEMSI
ncbi:hypothetical protein T01_2173 [Trichinella spiralis]|uniref:Uncharacterized protein n=1 Tax=Trichinella spiralis TaxID=6334 RepID=A0A0V1BKV8_TRISP|nr:hypothetical protein T01_2173 [Trichinella spiralis]